MTTQTKNGTGLLELDTDTLTRKFARGPFAVRHNLGDHPLFSLERIAELADSLEDGQVESNPGEVPEVLPGGIGEDPDLPPGEIVRGIDSNGYWIVLKRIESDPEYRALLDRSLDEVIPHVAHREGGASRKEAFIFLSAPNSTTPSHIDPEHNLLLQIRGSKDIVVGGFADPRAREVEIERYYGGGHRNLPAVPANAKAFHMEPGDGVYVPVHAPHMVKNGPTVSVSFSITFYTEASERLGDIYAVNARMRRLRLSPAPPGRHPRADRLKAGAWNGVRRSGRAVRRLAGRHSA